MTLADLKLEIQKYQYIEDTNIIDIALASIVATRLKLGDPIWLILIGASSGGKSQILRPLALTDPKYMHRVDDVTENTFLSGMKTNEGNNSLLQRIGSNGILVISDLTVIFSKSKESRAVILSQFRMIYDGEMTKMSGNQKEAITWKGSLGVIAGSTPSIYGNFEEVADMGERFIYYRMKEYDSKKATRLALGRSVYGKDLDNILSQLYKDYLKETTETGNTDFVLSSSVVERIIDVSILAEKIRTTAAMDWNRENIVRVPVPAMPMRIALQLMSLAKGLRVMRGRDLDDNDMTIIEWCAWSLANEEKRSCLKILAGLVKGTFLNTAGVADRIGLSTPVIKNVLQNMSAIGIVERSGSGEGLVWRIKDDHDYDMIQRILNLSQPSLLSPIREISNEDGEAENRDALDHALNNF